MPLVKNTITGNNHLVKINTDGDVCSRTAIRSYNKQVGANGLSSNRRFRLPFSYDVESHTLWVFVNGEKAVVEQTASNASQYQETDNKTVVFGAPLSDTDIIEFIVAGSYLNDEEVGFDSGGLEWILVSTAIEFLNDFGYMADTQLTPLSFTLPAFPSEGDTFAVADAFGTFGTNNAIIQGSGNNILGLSSLTLDRDGMAGQFVFDGIDNWLLVNDTGFASTSNWQVVGFDTNIADGDYGFMVDTRVTAITLILPPSPTEGDTFAVADAFSNFGTSPAILHRSGNNIQGLAQDFIFDKDGMAAQFVFDGIDNWVIVNDTGFISSGDWQIVSTSIAAVEGSKYMVDTTSGVVQITLPAAPEVNDEVSISDYSSWFAVNNLVMLNNGLKIMGVTEPLYMNVKDVTAKFVYTGSTQGWRIVTISS